jgi:hypothetical protein
MQIYQTDEIRAFSIPEACRRLGISRSSLWKYSRLRKIKLIRIGGRTLAPSYEIERLLREGVR